MSATDSPLPGLPQTDIRAASLKRVLRGGHYRYTSRVDLVEQVAGVLRLAGLVYDRHCELSADDHADFVVSFDLLVIVELEAGLSDMLPCLDRYALDARVGAIVVVTDRRELTYLAGRLHNKAVLVVLLDTFCEPSKRGRFQ